MGTAPLESAHMLLQSIVVELDRELQRLQEIRSIVAGLDRTPALVKKYIEPAVASGTPVYKNMKPTVAAAALVVEKAKPRRKPRADAGKPRERGTPKPKSSAEPGALTRNVLSGPVVFTPARLAEEKAKREQSRAAQVPANPAQPPEDLDALSRSLSARWSTGPIQ